MCVFFRCRVHSATVTDGTVYYIALVKNSTCYYTFLLSFHIHYVESIIYSMCEGLVVKDEQSLLINPKNY